MIGPIPMVVTTAALTNSGEVFNVLDNDSGGTKTFSVALSPSGNDNATHYGCYTYLDEDVENALRNMDVTQFKAFVDQKAALKGRTAPNNVTAFKNSLQMGAIGADFWSFVQAAGLKPINSGV